MVSSSTRSASGTRCGCRAPSGWPALEAPVRAPISTSGWPSSRRSSSPPAYPLAPATAILVGMCMTIQIRACLCNRGNPGARCRRRRPRFASMARLSSDDYLRHLRADSDRLRAVLDRVRPRRPGCRAARTGTPPTCSATTAACCEFWADDRRAAAGRAGRGLRRSRSSPTAYDALLAYHEEQSDRLVAALAAADPAERGVDLVGGADRRVHLPPAGARGADPPARRRADRRRRHAARPGAGRRRRRRGARRDVRRHARLGHVQPATAAYVRVDLADRGESVWVQPGRFTGTDPEAGKTYDERRHRGGRRPGRRAGRGRQPAPRPRSTPGCGGAATTARSPSPGTEAARRASGRCVNQPID